MARTTSIGKKEQHIPLYSFRLYMMKYFNNGLQKTKNGAPIIKETKYFF